MEDYNDNNNIPNNGEQAPGAPTGEQIAKYAANFTEPGFWQKVAKVAVNAGAKVVYAALLLYYVLKADTTPKKDRAKILGALGYFLLPLDLIPDWVPVMGYTDDLAALLWAVWSVAKNITPEVREKAQAQLRKIFGDKIDPATFEDLP